MMIRLVLTVCLALLSNVATAQTKKQIEVATGDVAALKQAILDANSGPADQITSILLKGEFIFSAQDTLPPIEREISIYGYQGAAIFRGDNGGPKTLFHIAADTKLWLTNVELTDFSLNHDGEALIENFGELELRKVQLSSVYSTRHCQTHGCTPAVPAIINWPSGQIQLRQVSIVDSGGIDPYYRRAAGLLINEGDVVAANVQMYLSGQSWAPPIVNSGTMLLVNSSFEFARQAAFPALDLVNLNTAGSAQITNSVFAGFSGAWCQQATSLGYNLIDAADCNWANEADLVGVSAGLLWRPVTGRWSSSGGAEILTNGLVLLAASGAVDSANPDYCPSETLTGAGRYIADGNGDGVSGCDRGAMELSPTGLADGGINGFYYDPDADGHYIYILENDFNTLVMWTTFDSEGKQAWIYGVGELKGGRSLIANTYINRNGRVTLDGDIEPAQDEHWGSLEIDMTSCTEGLVSFHSDLPEFGSGQFSIKRLAYVKQLGCTDL